MRDLHLGMVEGGLRQRPKVREGRNNRITTFNGVDKKPSVTMKTCFGSNFGPLGLRMQNMVVTKT
jgi:hypothetical protein